mmetsp:Transcript_109111/g.303433  ORF Transcript_109111/g.303433 Transcript_109111/m.303433 type:complete len:398 (-) Transcript_109111:8-1201(-)
MASAAKGSKASAKNSRQEAQTKLSTRGSALRAGATLDDRGAPRAAELRHPGHVKDDVAVVVLQRVLVEEEDKGAVLDLHRRLVPGGGLQDLAGPHPRDELRSAAPRKRPRRGAPAALEGLGEGGPRPRLGRPEGQAGAVAEGLRGEHLPAVAEAEEAAERDEGGGGGRGGEVPPSGGGRGAGVRRMHPRERRRLLRDAPGRPLRGLHGHGRGDLALRLRAHRPQSGGPRPHALHCVRRLVQVDLHADAFDLDEGEAAEGCREVGGGGRGLQGAVRGLRPRRDHGARGDDGDAGGRKLRLDLSGVRQEPAAEGADVCDVRSARGVQEHADLGEAGVSGVDGGVEHTKVERQAADEDALHLILLQFLGEALPAQHGHDVRRGVDVCLEVGALQADGAGP